MVDIKKKKKNTRGWGRSEVSHQIQSLVLDWRWDDLSEHPKFVAVPPAHSLLSPHQAASHYAAWFPVRWFN